MLFYLKPTKTKTMNLPFEDILKGIEDLKESNRLLTEKVEKLSVAKPIDGKMTREMVADHFHCNVKTVDRLVNKGKLQMYGLPGCSTRYFLQSEIATCLIKINSLKAA